MPTVLVNIKEMFRLSFSKYYGKVILNTNIFDVLEMYK